MCGICGVFDLHGKRRIDVSIIKNMTRKLLHRGPDGTNYYLNGNIGLGFSRLSIIDLEGGMQPLMNEDGSVVLVCNGEIFNFIELRQELISKGHIFKTRTDVEVILHLYEEEGTEFLNRLNAQFAFALFDFKKQRFFCGRDHFGILPFFYTITDGLFIFASEIKAILEYPGIPREVDLVGLDQVFSMPGLIAPRTMFRNIFALENGHYLLVKLHAPVKDIEYWDVDYPRIGEIRYHESEDFYLEQLNHLIKQAIKLRLRADVPVGLYISGGLDSSVVASITRELTPEVRRHSFSIDFKEKDKSESKFQRVIADFIHSIHFEKLFLFSDISRRLEQAVYHSEYPLKETYNTASLALSEAALKCGIKVVLTGEGADEWFAGYPGYKFDKFRQIQKRQNTEDELNESELNLELWGDEKLCYENNQFILNKVKKQLYSEQINEIYDSINCLKHKIVDKEKLNSRDIVHKRSYLDYKLRLVSHLVADHGDRVAYANSVEARYPFLDKDLVECVSKMPSHLKLKRFEEKYILKKFARNLVPPEIIKREKFAFQAPGSPYLLNREIEYINDLLSYDSIKKQGYFNPDMVERLIQRYRTKGFRLNIPYESDLLITVITFGIFLKKFELPYLN